MNDLSVTNKELIKENRLLKQRILELEKDLSAGNKHVEEVLRESEMKFRNLTETALDAIFTIDMKGVITYANPAARALADGRDMVGSHMNDIQPEFAEQQTVLFESVRQGFSEPLSFGTRITRPHFENPHYFDVKTSVLLNKGVPSGILFIARDSTDRRKFEDEIRFLALMDPLTGLFNRRGFVTLAEQRIKTASREKKKLLLFFMDLDSLKTINDTYGHEEGDSALKMTSVILRRTFRESDIIARLGGDEFAVLVSDSDELPEAILQRLKKRTDKENSTGALPYMISMSIGIADYNPSESCSIHDLLSRADRLMYASKREKKQSCEVSYSSH